MIGILVVTHGTFSQGIVNGMELICGKQEALDTMTLQAGDGIDAFAEELATKADALNSGDGVMILLDFMNGTPANVSCQYGFAREEISILGGLNFPMLIEAVNSRDCMSLQELTDICVETAADGVLDVKARLNGNA